MNMAVAVIGSFLTIVRLNMVSYRRIGWLPAQKPKLATTENIPRARPRLSDERIRL